MVFSPETIQEKVSELARQISRDYQGKELLLVGILKSSVFFLADLIRNISIPLTIDFIATAKYYSDSGSGIVKILKDLEENIQNKHLLLIRTIVDTGITLEYLIKNLKLRNPKSIKICTLLLREENRKTNLSIHYTGFLVGKPFLIGYGMDYQERFRNLPAIYELSHNREKEIS